MFLISKFVYGYIVIRGPQEVLLDYGKDDHYHGCNHTDYGDDNLKNMSFLRILARKKTSGQKKSLRT